VLAWRARHASGSARRFALCASAGFALYAVAAGIIAPTGSLWPSTAVNYRGFVALTGIPVQLTRGLLACMISLSVWGIWGQRHASEVGSPRYTTYVRQQFIWTLAAMGTILVCGWVLTERLGVIYQESLRKEARSDVNSDLLTHGERTA